MGRGEGYEECVPEDSEATGIESPELGLGRDWRKFLGVQGRRGVEKNHGEGIHDDLETLSETARSGVRARTNQVALEEELEDWSSQSCVFQVHLQHTRVVQHMCAWDGIARINQDILLTVLDIYEKHDSKNLSLSVHSHSDTIQRKIRMRDRRRTSERNRQQRDRRETGERQESKRREKRERQDRERGSPSQLAPSLLPVW